MHKNLKNNKRHHGFQRQLLRNKRVVQFVKYLMGGGVYFCSGFGLFAILYGWIGWDWLPSKIAGDAFGLSLGYLMARYWVFEHEGLKGKTIRTGVRYVIINISNLVIGYVIVAALYHVGISPYVGIIISALVATFLTYVCYRFWVFNPK